MRLGEPKTVWRLAGERHVEQAFDGEGARLYGGRWNHPGIPLVYTSASLSLAALELLVHLGLEDAPEDRVAIAAELPTGLDVEVIRAEDFPETWRRYPAPETSRDLGTAWAHSGRTAVLEVPSAVIPEESNYLLNPRHPEMTRVTIRRGRPFTFDRRLWTGDEG